MSEVDTSKLTPITTNIPITQMEAYRRGHKTGFDLGIQEGICYSVDKLLDETHPSKKEIAQALVAEKLDE